MKTDAAREYLTYVISKTGMSPTALAKLVGIAPTTLTRFLNDPEHKFRLSRATIEKIETKTHLPFRGDPAEGFEEPAAPQIDVIGALSPVAEPVNLVEDGHGTIKIAVVDGVIQVAATVDLDSYPKLLKRLENARKMAADED